MMTRFSCLDSAEGRTQLGHLQGSFIRSDCYPPDQINIAHYALTSYKRASGGNDLSIAWNFSRVIGGRRVTIKFVGVWDTVASVLVPRRDSIIPALQTLPYTRRNPSVHIFRHAMAIDERRRMFRLNRWISAQPFVPNPFEASAPQREQDIKQVWFAGVHADVGGGYPENESGLSKFPLDWMIEEGKAHGLMINVAIKNPLALGKPRIGAKNAYVKPDPAAQVHRSLTLAWQPPEWIPKSVKWREWHRQQFFGYYLPNAEPRMINDTILRPRIHQVSTACRWRAAARGLRREAQGAAREFGGADRDGGR
jgi:Uncharacterized alpha/beta hydrolase domain (DUF2235)